MLSKVGDCRPERTIVTPTPRGAAVAIAAAAALATSLLAHPPAAAATGSGRPDLVVTKATVDHTTIAEGAELSVKHTVRSKGAAAAASTTRFYLTSDVRRSRADRKASTTNPRSSYLDLLLDGAASVPALGSGKKATVARAVVTVPVGTPAGKYTVLVCADDLGQVAEVKETDNCRPAAKLLRVTAAPGSADLRLQTFADTYRWPSSEDDAVRWMGYFCANHDPVRPMTPDQAVASARATLTAAGGAAALETVAASPLAATPVKAQQLAAVAVTQGDPGLALVALLRAHDLAPRDAGLLVDAAAMAVSIGLPNEAIGMLDGAAGRSFAAPAMGVSQQAIALSIRGQALLMTGRTAQAARLFKQAKAQAPLLSEADAGLANVNACAGDPATAARYVRASRQREQVVDALPTGPEDRPEPSLDLSGGKAMPLRKVPVAATPAQGVAMDAIYDQIQHRIGGEVTTHVGERSTLNARIRTADLERTSAEQDRRDSILVAIYKVHEAADLRAQWDQIGAQIDELTEQREGFFGGGTGESPYVYGELADKAWDACAGSTDPHCWIKQMNATCRPELTLEHATWTNRITRLQGAVDSYFATYSTRMSAYAANLADPDAHRLALLTIEETETDLYALVVGPAAAWAHDERLYEDECVTPLDTQALDAQVASGAPSPGSCPEWLKGINGLVSLGPVTVKLNCEKVQVGVSSEVAPLLGLFGELTYDVRAGAVTIAAGGNLGGTAGDVVTAGFKSGLYLTVDTVTGDMKDVGWRVGPSATVGTGPLEVGVFNDEMDLSFAPAPTTGT